MLNGLNIHADDSLVWNWTYTGTTETESGPVNFSDSGTITTLAYQTTNPNTGLTGYRITDISGLWSGISITGLIPPGPTFYNDNYLFTASSDSLQLDTNGVAFSTATNSFNLYGIGSTYMSYDTNNNYDGGGTFIAVQAIPEPATYVLLFLGILAIGMRGFFFHRRIS